jgi:hypothetical protein
VRLPPGFIQGNVAWLRVGVRQEKRKREVGMWILAAGLGLVAAVGLVAVAHGGRTFDLSAVAAEPTLIGFLILVGNRRRRLEAPVPVEAPSGKE